jgi:protein-tyrosine phosphatase
VIDLHIHILPGVDDGPADMAASVELARACVADGIAEVAATPHVSERYFTSPSTIERGLADLRAALEQADVDLEIHSGAEVAIDRLEHLSDADIRALTLGGGSHILLETPYVAWPIDLERHTTRLAGLGIRAVLAHPERSAGVQAAGGIERLAAVSARGVLVQVTAGSLTGGFGRRARRTARELLERELVQMIAGDAHDAQQRAPRMRGAAEAVGDAELARWLTTEVPHAVLTGERLPPRPPARPRKAGGGLRARIARANGSGGSWRRP